MLDAEKLNKATQYFKDIYDRKNNLVTRLLDFSDDPLDSMVDANQDKLLAFKLLMHAEMEYYLESVTREVIERCKTEWTANSHLNPIILRLLAYNKTEYAGNARDNDPRVRITNVINGALTQIGQNHGIKEKNQLKLMQQIGVNVLGDHNTLSSDLESYGAHRGVIAHSGISHIASISNPLMKRSETTKIDQIMDLLYDLDIDIQRLYGLVIFPVSFSDKLGI